MKKTRAQVALSVLEAAGLEEAPAGAGGAGVWYGGGGDHGGDRRGVRQDEEGACAQVASASVLEGPVGGIHNLKIKNNFDLLVRLL